jgi:type IV secretory pathway protease TraF
MAEWRLGPDEFFVLGDFPSASRDSRHWGPLGRRDCENRAAAAAGKGAGSIKWF